MTLGGRQAYSTNNETSINISFSPKKIGKNDKCGKLAGKFSTNGSNDTHTYSLQRKIFGPSQFGVTSPFMTKNGDMVFTIYRRFPYGPATCDYAVSDGTGVLGNDYAALDPLNGTLSFADREMHRTVTIATMADGATDKTVLCTLGATSGSFIEGEHIGTGTIMEPTKGVYYFDATLGNDANGGSIYRPKKTWAALSSALKNAGPGDAFLFKRGETFIGSWVRPRTTQGGGKGGNPVIIGAYGDLADPIPIIDGDATFLTFLNEPNCLQNITIQDIFFTTTNAPGSRPTYALIIGDAGDTETLEDIRVERVEISNLQKGLTTIKALNAVVRFCYVHNNYTISPETGHSSGMFCSKSDAQILEYNLFHDNGKRNVDPDLSSVFDWQLYMSGTDNCKTRWNIMRDGPNIDKFRGDTNYEVRGNIFTGGDKAGGGGGGDNNPYHPSSNITYAQNYKSGRRLLMNIGEGSGSPGWTPGDMLDEMDIHSNIFHNEGDYDYVGVLNISDNSSQNVRIFNNLMISTSIDGCVSLNASGYINISMKNNIIMRQAIGATSDKLVEISAAALAEVDLENNLYFNNGSAGVYLIKDGASYTAYSSLAALQAAYPAVELGSIEADPLIADIDRYNYSLLAGSPAIGFGHPASIDFYGGTSSKDAGPIPFGDETSDRFSISGDELKVLYPLSEGTETINVISNDSTGFSLEGRFTTIVSGKP